MFNNDMREVLNINLEFMGQDQGQQSGIAMKQKIAQQLIGNDFLFDNLSFAKKKIGQIVIKKIAKTYTTERIMRILSNQNSKQISMNEKPVELTGPEGKKVNLTDIPPDAIQRILDTSDLTKYDIIVSESPNSPSAMVGNFLMLMELAGKGISIPPEAILEFAPIPHKDKIIDMIKNAQAETAAQEDKKYQTEIAKTMIGKGVMPGNGQAGMMPPGGGMA